MYDQLETTLLIGQDGGYTQDQTSFKEVRKIIDTTWATVGEVSNDVKTGSRTLKGRKNRWRGIRPTVRGRYSHEPCGSPTRREADKDEDEANYLYLR